MSPNPKPGSLPSPQYSSSPQALSSLERVCLEGSWGENSEEQQNACVLQRKQTSPAYRPSERRQCMTGGGCRGREEPHKGMLFEKAGAGHQGMDRCPFIPQPGLCLKTLSVK